MGTAHRLVMRAGSAALITAGILATGAAPAVAAAQPAESRAADGCPPGMARMMQQMSQNPDGMQMMHGDDMGMVRAGDARMGHMPGMQMMRAGDVAMMQADSDQQMMRMMQMMRACGMDGM